jgi:RecA-family ATPase
MSSSGRRRLIRKKIHRKIEDILYDIALAEGQMTFHQKIEYLKIIYEGLEYDKDLLERFPDLKMYFEDI